MSLATWAKRAETSKSPWNALRTDEVLRAEIQQDVDRCMPDNPYFRESKTQETLLNILFIFCKLNVDVGYRQGMHELLAPILWVVSQDAVESQSADLYDDSGKLLEALLAWDFVEHDAFTLFCIVMQTAKSFYENGANAQRSAVAASTNSPIVERSHRIHGTYLRQADPKLADHLHSIDILPQIFIMWAFPSTGTADRALTVADGGYACYLAVNFHSRTFFVCGMCSLPKTHA